jgi:hypothetical protein
MTMMSQLTKTLQGIDQRIHHLEMRAPHAAIAVPLQATEPWATYWDINKKTTGTFFAFAVFFCKHLSDVLCCAANTASVALLQEQMYPTDQQIEECLGVEFGADAIRQHRFNFRTYSANAVRTTRWAWKDELRQVFAYV